MDLSRIDGSVPEPNEVRPDSEAKKEARELFGDEKRKEETKQAAHKVFIRFLQVAAVMFFILLCVRVLHFVLPDHWCWLTAERLQSMDKVLFGGAVGSVITKYVKQILPEHG